MLPITLIGQKNLSTQVTLKEIAEALGISAMTVSRALNNQPNVDETTRERVMAKAQEMGYTPNHVAKSLVSSKTYTIGVVIPEITHAFFPEVVQGIEEVTAKFDYQLFLTNSNESFETEEKSLKNLRAKRVDGILLSSSLTTEDYSFYKQIINNGPEIVFFDRCIEDLNVSCVSVNDFDSARKITQHLIQEHGYTKIACLTGPQQVSIGQKRYKGYLKAMQDNGLPVNEEWVVEAGFQEKLGYEAMQKVLESPDTGYPEAVVAVNDPCAIGAIQAIKEAGLSIPEDIAIVGFTNDIRAPLLEVPLTTVNQKAYSLGIKAAEKLIKTIENPNEPVENIEVVTELEIRASCGCSN